MPLKSMHTGDQIVESFSRCTKNGFVACNLAGEVTYISDSMEDLSGWLESELIGQPVSKLYALPESISNSIDIQDAKSQPAVVYKRDGNKITLPARQVTIKDPETGEIDGYLTLFINQKGDIGRAQSDFISTVSHELRTPITSIKGFAATLLQHRSKLAEDKRKKYINIIRDQADRLSRLVEDLLAVSRLESKKLQLTIQPLNIKNAVEKIATIVEQKHESSHAISIDAEPNLAFVWADSDRLEQILTNLIDNAVKYSPEADKVEIKIHMGETNGQEMMQIDIRDFGIGIEEEDLDKIFGKFSRLDSPLTRNTEGTGLGLFITKSLTNVMKGDVVVNSEKGKGTTFTVFLPTNSYTPDYSQED